MAREIKFRGKRYGDGDWVYGNLYQGTTDGEQYSIILNDAGYHVAPQDDRNLAIAFAENKVNVVFTQTVCQFTGLLDKNGKEIYEGDIIRSYDSENNPIIHSISWDNKKACYVATMLQYPLLGGSIDKGWIDEFEKEVIGNVFDNPELLKTETL